MATNQLLLENELLNLRALEPEDLVILYRWENDTRLWKYAHAIAPYSKMALRQYISDSLTMDIWQSKQLRLMIELKSTGETIGTIDLYEIDAHHRRAGLGILIDEEHRNKNYASEALLLMHRYIFQLLKLNQIFAYIGVENKPSLLLFRKTGYVLSGTLRNWVIAHSGGFEDVHIMQLLKD